MARTMRDWIIISVVVVSVMIAFISWTERAKALEGISVAKHCDFVMTKQVELEMNEMRRQERTKERKQLSEIENGIEILSSNLTNLFNLFENERKNNREPRNIFLDFGANKGDSVKSFVSDENAQGGQSLKMRGKDGGWEIFAFEANPVFDSVLIGLESEINDKGINKLKVFYSTAISYEDGIVEFYLDTVNEKQDFWGSSLLESHPDVIASGKTSVKVPCVDIHTFITKNFLPKDYVIIKLDIEGTEFQIFRHMFLKGTIDYIDEFYVEFHDRLGFEGSEHLNAIKWIMKTSGKKFITDWN